VSVVMKSRRGRASEEGSGQKGQSAPMEGPSMAHPVLRCSPGRLTSHPATILKPPMTQVRDVSPYRQGHSSCCLIAR
jgi:hypothetical protein